MLRAGGLKSLTDALKSAKIYITAVQETRWPGINILKNREYAFYNSGTINSQGSFGTGFVVLRQAMDAVIDFKPIDERLCTLRLKGKFFNITLINAHAPTEDKDDDVKDVFYETLQNAYNNAPTRDIKIVLGDFNAKIGREAVYYPNVGKHSRHQTTNENGTRLVDFAVSNNMVVSSTHFPHKDIHKITWVSPDGYTKNQIDHVLIDDRHKSNINDVRSCRGLNIDSDHYLVRMICRARIHAQPKHQQTVARRYDIKKFKNDEIKLKYVEKMENRIIAKADRSSPESVNEKWNELKRDVELVAEEVVGYQTTTRSRNDWFDDECQTALAEKNAARNKYLQRATRANLNVYREKRNFERKLFRRKKRQKESEFFDEIQLLSNNKDTRGLYRRVKQTRAGYTQQPFLCKSLDGSLITDEERCLLRWTEYFNELLNSNTNDDPVANRNQTETHVQPQPFITEPSIDEVIDSISKLKNNKTPGSDSIPAELFKYGGNALVMEMHELITQIWNKEELPDDWKIGVICPIHKKGDKLECRNYRGITLLNIAYKIFANVLFQRLLPYAEENIGEYQCGFRRDRSTTDQIFSLRQILEKCREYNVDTHHLFVDFKAAYDSVMRSELWNTMAEFGFPHKLIALTKLTLFDVTSRVKIRNQLSEPFTTADGLRQGDPLASLLFNIVLEKAVRSSNVDVNNTIYRKSVQVLAYADDIDIVTRSVRQLNETFTELQREAAKLGLKVNEDKTKYMRASTNSPPTMQTIQLNESHFQVVDSFTYLGSLVNGTNVIGEEVRRRVTIGNRCYYSLKKLFQSKSLSRKLKCTLYKSLVRPVVSYGSEAWVMTQKDENYLRIFERKILRAIFGAVFESDVWRRRYNHELDVLYNEPDIVRFIKINRLRWFGHVQRMASNRIQLKVHEGWPDGNRRAGRPRGRWKDAVLADIKRMRIHDWKTLTGNRPGWRRMLMEAKTHSRL